MIPNTTLTPAQESFFHLQYMFYLAVLQGQVNEVIIFNKTLIEYYMSR